MSNAKEASPSATRDSSSPRAADRPPRRRRIARLLVLALVVYAALLVVSHVVRRLRPDAPPAVRPAIELPAVEGARSTAGRVRLAYRDSGPAQAGPASVIVLLHGSPGSSDDFAAVVPVLQRRHRVLAPDLPGFGESTRDIPDYSIEAHAAYVIELLDRLGVDQAHFVGFSMGGGVALELYQLAPQRVLSLTLLSSIGVQELELFGNYRMNRIVHGAQLLGLWLLREGLPHMGRLDRAFLGLPYARNFYDSDQRPLRGVLQRFEPPMSIVHGRADFLVPPEAALEHHRLVPQSELHMLEASHFMVFADGEQTARRIADFVSRVDQGAAPRRADAAPERSTAAREPFDPADQPPYHGFALWIMMGLISVSTLVTEDLACIAAGLVVAQGRMNYWPALIACFIGIFFGDVLLFLAGRYLGRPALRRAPLRWFIREEHVEIASRWLDRRGPVVIAVSRFVPGTRLPTYFTVGMLQTNLVRFSLYFFVAVAVWTPLLVALSTFVGERAFAYFDLFQRRALPALVLLALGVLFVAHIVVPAFTFHGRRKLYGRWRRLCSYEFWPPWMFYPPVLAWIAGLALRHRSALLFTAANPAIEAGGVIAESKYRILQGLAGAGERIARTHLIPVDEDADRRVDDARAFMEGNALTYPVVLKPDAGQRGSGVVIARSDERLRSYLVDTKFDTLVQEYAPGDEFGIFYYRYPDESRGHIFSITQKRIPFVVGDGRHTIEHLVLSDRRAVCMADHYMTAQADQLFRVPEAGEKVELVELGTHCRGAIFLDGGWALTDALERAVDEISRAFDGFYFGRYDVRTPDVEKLKRGLDFKVIELNGVTSEATHIYDPKIGLRRAYGILFEQWRIAFEIGRRNRGRGAVPARPAELMRLLRHYRRISRTHPG